MLPHASKTISKIAGMFVAAALLISPMTASSGDCDLCVSCAAPCAITANAYAVPPAVPLATDDGEIREPLTKMEAATNAGLKRSAPQAVPTSPKRIRTIRSYYPTVMPETDQVEHDWSARPTTTTAFDLKLGENIVR